MGSLIGTPTPENSGSFWLDTVENADEGCSFTTLSIADGVREIMDDGWNDLLNIDVTSIVAKAAKAATDLIG